MEMSVRLPDEPLSDQRPQTRSGSGWRGGTPAAWCHGPSAESAGDVARMSWCTTSGPGAAPDSIRERLAWWNSGGLVSWSRRWSCRVILWRSGALAGAAGEVARMSWCTTSGPEAAPGDASEPHRVHLCLPVTTINLKVVTAVIY